MRIEFTTQGGIAHFPGLARPVVIDTDTLTEAEASELARLLEAARFFERPAGAVPPRRGAADCRQYTITAEGADRLHTVNVFEPVEDPALQPLLRFLQTKARELRRGSGGS